MEYLPAEEIVDFSAYRPALLAYARCLTSSVADAEDLTQSTLLAALENAEQLQNRDDPKPWLFTILRNRFHRAARQREVAVGDDYPWTELAVNAGWSAPSAGNDPFLQAATAERHQQLEAAFLALDAEDREILLLRDIEELSGPEASGLLGLSIAAMKSRLHRARLRLLAELRHNHLIPARNEAMEMTCLEVLQCLPHYADQTLSPDARSSVERHVAHCRACAHFGQRYADLLAALPSLRDSS
ncbi:hypothetical protein F183_A03090 [Bryobacterales bacterium F-183]|nr:hypothetical protein F183_A03090 [Bryobacterales bacterium F-183]